MNHSLNLNTYLNVLSLVALAVVGYYVVRSKIKNENIKDLKERVEILEKSKIEAEKQHMDNQKAISNLEGQLSTYKEIPLKQIATSLTELSKSNEMILNVLQANAIISAKDLATDQHVKTQTVDKQVVNKEQL